MMALQLFSGSNAGLSPSGGQIMKYRNITEIILENKTLDFWKTKKNLFT